MTRFLVALLCLLSWPAAALELTYGAGTFTPSQTTFTAADQPVTIRCAGSNQTILTLPAGLSITYSDQRYPPAVIGCTLATEAAGGGTALTITGPTLPTATLQGPRVYDVSIRGLVLTEDYWTRGLRFVDVWNPVVRDVNVKGLDQASPPFSMQTAIEFERTQVMDVEKFDAYHVQDAVRQIGTTYGEGLSIRDFNLVGVNRGMDLKQGSGYVVADGHVNSFCRGIDVSKTQIEFRNLLLYKTHYSTCDYVGIYPNVAQQLKIVNTIIDGGWQTAQQNSGATYGIVMSVTTKSFLSGNLCTNFRVTSACIVVGYQSANNTIIGNRSDGAGTVVQVNGDAGTGNYVTDNKP